MRGKVVRCLESGIISREGGGATSTYLRKITLKRNNVEVGLYSYSGVFEKGFNLGGRVVVGRYSSIGSNVRYFGANHPITCFSTSPYFYRQEWADKVGGRFKILNALLCKSEMTAGSEETF